MKKLLMKLLGIETPSQKLVRLQINQAVRLGTINRIRNSLNRLTKIHSEYPNEDQHKELVASHINFAQDKLKKHQADFAEHQMVIDLIRNTLEAEKGIHG